MRSENSPIRDKPKKKAELASLYAGLKKLDDEKKMYIAGAVAALATIPPMAQQTASTSTDRPA